MMTDLTSLNQAIVISALICDSNYSGPNCISDSEHLTVIVKLGKDFMIGIPKSLSIKNLYFDALDSVIPTQTCTSETTPCCTIDASGGLVAHPDNVGSPNCVFQNTPDDHCDVAYGHPVLKFLNNKQMMLSEPNSLTLQNSAFINFMYGVSSLIELNSKGGHVTVTGTKFERFTSCGSIIRTNSGSFDPFQPIPDWDSIRSAA